MNIAVLILLLSFTVPGICVHCSSIECMYVTLVNISTSTAVYTVVYEVVVYTRSTFGAAEPSAPDQGFKIDADLV